MKEDKLLLEGDINISKAREEWYKSIECEETKQLLEEDSTYFLHQVMSTPCLEVLGSCSDAKIITKSGKEIYDFHGNSVHQIGFRNQFVIEQLKKQLDILPFSTRRYTNEPAIKLARKLTSLLPDPLNRVLFAPGGTSAVGMALKLARAITGKHKIVSLWDSFHGASLDSISAGGEAIFRQGMGPLMPGVLRIPPPTSYRGIFGGEESDQLKYADYLEYVIEKEGEVGAFLIETIRNTDVQIPPLAYWKRIREICDKYDVLLILDEIPIALGRTGKMFSFEHFGIQPDIMCLGKGLGGGIIPFAAMVCRDDFNIVPEVSLGHYTHEKNPLGCTAAHATIDFIQNENLLDKVKEDEQFMSKELHKLMDEFELIGDIRGIGLMWAIELVTDRKTKSKASVEAEKLMYKCLKNGLSFKVSKGNVILLSPALTIKREELVEALDILRNALAGLNELVRT